jgi:hypothetical protein
VERLLSPDDMWVMGAGCRPAGGLAQRDTNGRELGRLAARPWQSASSDGRRTRESHLREARSRMDWHIAQWRTG